MRRKTWMMCFFIGCVIAITQYGGHVLAQDVPDDAVITVDTVDALHLAYVLPACGAISPDGIHVSGESGVYDVFSGELILDKVGEFGPDGLLLIHKINDGMALELYDLALGELMITFDGYDIAFSPDQQLIAVSGDGVYELYSWHNLYTIGGFLGSRASLAFSEDGSLLAVGGDGIYDVASGWRYFGVRGAITFNHAGTLAAVSRGGVFDAITSEELYPVTGHTPQFSADDTLLLLSEDGLYEAASGEKIFPLQGYAQFSPDSAFIAVDYDGVYTVDGEKVFDVAGFKGESLPRLHADFSPDSSLLAVMNDGLYDVATGEQLQTLVEGLPQFAPDGSYLTVNGDDGCAIYRVDEMAPAIGLVRPAYQAGVNVRATPGSDSVMAGSSARMVVFAQNSDASWYKVQTPAGFGWVSSGAVEVIFMPDDLPEETP